MNGVMVRQGDVLLMPVSEIPTTATVQPRDNGRVVLAYGEVTGHAHAITRPGVTRLADGTRLQSVSSELVSFTSKGSKMDAYCEDCKMIVHVIVTTDYIGDPEVINGLQPIKVWNCSECGGEEITEGKQSAVPEDENGALRKDKPGDFGNQPNADTQGDCTT